MTRPVHRPFLCLMASATLCAGAPADGASPATPPAERALHLSATDPALQWGDCPPVFPSGCKIAVLHGRPSEPAADVFLRVPAGYVIPAHSHTSAERMVLVEGQLDVTYAGHPTARLQRGEYAYGPAALPHEARCSGTEACTLFIAFNGAMDAFRFEGPIVGVLR